MSPVPYSKVRLSTMDESEPGRCRRTDGKKWRCKKEVIPNEKYCEKHMHRGCRRGSRKLVESSYSNKLTVLPTSTTTTTAAGNHSSKENPSSDALKPHNALSSVNESRPKLVITPPPQPKSSSSLSLQLKIQPPNGTTSSHYESIAVSRVKEEVKKGGCETAKHYPVMPKIEIKSAAPPATVSAASVGREHFNLSRKSRDLVKVGGDGSDCGKVEDIMIGEITKSKSRNGGVTTSVSSGLDFSPKSVLRDGQVCSLLLLNQKKAAADLHMLQSRCRRTDGKRWRCSKEVVSSDQKYCAKHMHRGAKKQRPSMVFSSPYCSSNNGGRSDCDLRLCSNLDPSVKQAKKVVLGMDN